MPMIDVSPAAFNYLKSLAEPFVDTPESVLERVIVQHRRFSESAVSPADSSGEPAGATLYRMSNIPPMRFTRIEGAELDGKQLVARNWNTLIEELIRTCRAKGYVPEEIQKKLRANTANGRGAKHLGYRFIREVDFSFQGLDAQRACEAALELATDFVMHLTISFSWRQNDSAHRPGARAKITNR